MYFNDKTILFYDGEYIKATEAHTDVYGQSLHYGYSVFEGIRSYKTERGARVFKATEHYERLKRSCELLGIPLGYSVEELTAITYEVLQRNGFESAYIRPLVLCEPNMTLINGQPTKLIICAWNWGAYLGEKLLSIKVSSYCRPHPRSIHIEAKAGGHYVNSILATSEARKAGYDEALLLDCEGNLAEGPGANLFFEKNGQLYTPQLGHILPGITRATLLELCEEMDISVTEGQFSTDDLFSADSAFFCGTGAEVVGIKAVDDYVFPLAWSDALGSKIRKAYLDLVQEKQPSNHLQTI